MWGKQVPSHMVNGSKPPLKATRQCTEMKISDPEILQWEMCPTNTNLLTYIYKALLCEKWNSTQMSICGDWLNIFWFYPLKMLNSPSSQETALPTSGNCGPYQSQGHLFINIVWITSMPPFTILNENHRQHNFPKFRVSPTMPKIRCLCNNLVLSSGLRWLGTDSHETFQGPGM